MLRPLIANRSYITKIIFFNNRYENLFAKIISLKTVTLTDKLFNEYFQFDLAQNQNY